jgi:hypothetical protein
MTDQQTARVHLHRKAAESFIVQMCNACYAFPNGIPCASVVPEEDREPLTLVPLKSGAEKYKQRSFPA